MPEHRIKTLWTDNYLLNEQLFRVDLWELSFIIMSTMGKTPLTYLLMTTRNMFVIKL